MREILGKKMSAKLRKDMDDVSERTGIPLRSCQRQVYSVFFINILLFLMCIILLFNFWVICEGKLFAIQYVPFQYKSLNCSFLLSSH